MSHRTSRLLTGADYRDYDLPMLHTEQAIERVIQASKLVTKFELAQRAGVPESTIRELGKPDWKPNTATLERLEKAAQEIERGHHLDTPTQRQAAAG